MSLEGHIEASSMKKEYNITYPSVARDSTLTSAVNGLKSKGSKIFLAQQKPMLFENFCFSLPQFCKESHYA